MAVSNLSELLYHQGHDVQIIRYGDGEAPDSVTLECNTCDAVLLEFNTACGAGLALGSMEYDHPKNLAEMLRSGAAELFEKEGELEIDSNALISFGGDEPGAYVQAWVWTPFADVLALSHLGAPWEDQFPMELWQEEVSEGKTTLGLDPWRIHKRNEVLEEVENG